MKKKGYTIWFDSDEDHKRVKKDVADGLFGSMRDALLSGVYKDGFSPATGNIEVTGELRHGKELHIADAISDKEIPVSKPLDKGKTVYF